MIHPENQLEYLINKKATLKSLIRQLKNIFISVSKLPVKDGISEPAVLYLKSMIMIAIKQQKANTRKIRRLKAGKSIGLF